MIDLVITNPAGVKEAIVASYICAAIVAAVFVILFLIIANLIPWERGTNDKSPSKRRACWSVLLVLAAVAQWAITFFMYYQDIQKSALKSQYFSTTFITAAVAAVVFGIVTFVIIKIKNPRSKIGSTFAKN